MKAEANWPRTGEPTHSSKTFHGEYIACNVHVSCALLWMLQPAAGLHRKALGYGGGGRPPPRMLEVGDSPLKVLVQLNTPSEEMGVDRTTSHDGFAQSKIL